MRTLLLLRHAQAASAEDSADDAERALTPGGRAAARALAGWFRARAVSPDLVLCSAALRARETLDLVRKGFARPARIELDPALYLAPWGRLLEAIRGADPAAGTLLVVGHNPGLQELAMSLAVMAPRPEREKLARGFPTGALVRFDVERGWAAFNRASIRLAGFVTPGELGGPADNF